jgi:hypothetical protein
LSALIIEENKVHWDILQLEGGLEGPRKRKKWFQQEEFIIRTKHSYSIGLLNEIEFVTQMYHRMPNMT